MDILFICQSYMDSKQDFSFGVIPMNEQGGEVFFLLIQHLHGHGGHWAFPKGHKEENETDTETALRELSEETGLQNVELKLDKQFFEYYDFEQNNIHIHKTVKYFLGITKDKEVKIQDSEIGDYKWLKAEDALQQITFEEGKKMFREVLADLGISI